MTKAYSRPFPYGNAALAAALLVFGMKFDSERASGKSVCPVHRSFLQGQIIS